MADDKAPPATIKRRSPRYPGISVDVAITRARAIYQHEKMNVAPPSAIVGHWGLSAGSSSANIALASLKSYGLLVDQGQGENRVLKLSDLAQEILLNPDKEAVSRAVRDAALSPRLHRELYDEFGTSLPSDASLKYRLIKERNFTESGAQDFIAQFKKTFAFALSDVTDSVEPDSTTGTAQSEDEEVTRPVDAHTPPAALPPGGPGAGVGMSIPIPLMGGTPVQISGQFPISEAAWQQLLRVLEAMKPGLVEAPATPAEHD